ncbi:Branched-chain amino acid transport system II carrier protein, partial [gut metagenome]
IGKNPYVYPCTVGAVGLVSVLYALDKMHLPLGFVAELCSVLPFYKEGMGWVLVAVVMTCLCILIQKFANRDHSAA